MKRYFIPCLLMFFSTVLVFAQNHEEEIRSWQKKRLQSLTAEEGWVTLAGLFWLEGGENSFGKSADNRLIANYPGLPDYIGVFSVEHHRVSFSAQPGIEVNCDGKPISRIEMTSDQDGKATVLRYKAFSWYVIKRGDRLGVRMKWSDHPNRKKLTHIPSYPISDTWRIKARYIAYDTARTLSIPTVIGIDSEEECPGEIHLRINGQAIVLYPTGTRDSLGLMFGDATNGRETYSAGRFLPLPKPDESNEMILDFNLAYNPPCVFTPFATCPMPIPENIIGIPVEAGEKMVDLFPH